MIVYVLRLSFVIDRFALTMFLLLVGCLFAFAAADRFTPIDFKDAQVWRIRFENETQFANYELLLAQQNFDFDEWRTTRNNTDILVPKNQLVRAAQLFDRNNFHKEILIEDVQYVLENEKDSSDRSYLRFGNQFNYDSYHGHEIILKYLEKLSIECGPMCELVEIGKSYENRPLVVLKIRPRQSQNKKSVLIDGGIHAREWISPVSVVRIAEYLIRSLRPANGSADQVPKFILNQDWYLIPVLNPDGYEFTRTSSQNRFWRKNRRVVHKADGSTCIGVDLNRNFGYKWGGSGGSKMCQEEIYWGQGAFSEPESQALKNFVASIPKLHTYLTYHSYGEMLLHPWGYESKISKHLNYLSEIAKKASEEIYKVNQHRFRYGSSADVLYSAAGGSDDWMFSQKSTVCSYTIELRGGNILFFNGFILPESQIRTATEEALVAAIELSNSCFPIESKPYAV